LHCWGLDKEAGGLGLPTERTRQVLWRLRHGQTRHVAAERPGELLCLDTFYIGKLKGVGKVWQVPAGDAASSNGIGRILPVLSAAAVAGFLRHVIVPAVRRAGWSVQRVLTDGGGEFKAEFAQACRERSQPSRRPAVLRLRPAAPWLPHPRSDAGDHLPWGRGGHSLNPCTTLGRQTCRHHSESGQSRRTV